MTSIRLKHRVEDVATAAQIAGKPSAHGSGQKRVHRIASYPHPLWNCLWITCVQRYRGHMAQGLAGAVRFLLNSCPQVARLP